MERSWKRRGMVLALVLAAAASCADLDDGAPVETAQGPGIGLADSLDSADRSCRVVLRTAGPVGDTSTGYDTSCDRHGCWFVFAGAFDVSVELLDDGGKPAVLFQSSEEPGWWWISAQSTGGASVGFRRFRFELSSHTAFAAPASGGPSADTTLEVIPFVKLPTGARVFDHNRQADDTENYVLSADNGWTIAEDPRTCPTEPEVDAPVAVVSFPAEGEPTLDGRLVRGGTLRVEYAVERLPLRNTHNGHPCWELQAYVLFSSDDRPYMSSVNGIGSEPDAVYVSPIEREPTLIFDVRVPDDARRVELWFRNYTGCDSPDEVWDSDFGANYVYGVN